MEKGWKKRKKKKKIDALVRVIKVVFKNSNSELINYINED